MMIDSEMILKKLREERDSQLDLDHIDRADGVAAAIRIVCSARNEPSQEFAVIESMTTIEHEGLTVRVWREESDICDTWQNEDIRRAVKSFVRGNGRLLAAEIARMDRVNAVEVKDATGCGIVLYREWP